MKLKNFYYFIILLYLISFGTSYSIEQPDVKNLIIHKEKKIIKGVYFFDSLNNKKTLDEYKNNISLINFWATWCTPCKEEMPSLNNIKNISEFKNINIIPINIGEEGYDKSKDFFDELGIDNLEIFNGPSGDLAKKFKLRGVPTTVILDKEGFEISRIIGSINFLDKQFLDWLMSVVNS
tara:strand:+ start:67 stop:603 length:537 start_codon:yes stop_codon:yes gene_type:complete